MSSNPQCLSNIVAAFNILSPPLPSSLLPACRPTEDCDSEGALNGKDVGEEATPASLYQSLQHHISAQSVCWSIPSPQKLTLKGFPAQCFLSCCGSSWMVGAGVRLIICIQSSNWEVCLSLLHTPDLIYWRPHRSSSRFPGCAVWLSVTLLLWVCGALRSHFDPSVIFTSYSIVRITTDFLLWLTKVIKDAHSHHMFFYSVSAHFMQNN